MKRRISPALVLLFLSPAIGELLSSSSPPKEFFFPPILAAQVALYGCGALLIREATLRWKKGWPSIFVLGVAYAIVEEGLLCKSFFDPNWMDLGDLAHYGRWAGVNWVWTLNLLIYHTFISIAVPILLTESIFPHLKEKPWARRKGLVVAAFFLTLDVLLGYFVLKPHGYPAPYKPPTLYAAISLVIVVLLIVIAKKLPEKLTDLPIEKTSAPHPAWLGFLGFVLMPMAFLIPALTRKAGGTFPVTMLNEVIAAVFGIWMVSKWSTTNTAWPDKHRPILRVLATVVLLFVAFLLTALSLDKLKVLGLFIVPVIITGVVLVARRIPGWLRSSVPWSHEHALALATGALIPFIIGTFIEEAVNAKRPDDTTGMSAVGVAFALFLVWLWSKVNRRELQTDGDIECTLITPQTS